MLPGCVADRVIFQPPARRVEARGSFHLDLDGGAGRIAVRYLPAPAGGRTLLYSHGNAEDLALLADLVDACRARGYGILAYDYEGYGTSDGTPSEQAAYRDIERCWKFLTEEKRLPPSAIVVYGRSVGSGPATWLAARRRPFALVLEAPFTSAFAVVGLDWLPGDRFPNLKRIDRVKCPLLIIHGDGDQVVPLSHGEALYKRASAMKKLDKVRGAGHNDILETAGEAYWANLRAFLSEAESFQARNRGD